jgi:hypothetical protein
MRPVSFRSGRHIRKIEAGFISSLLGTEIGASFRTCGSRFDANIRSEPSSIATDKTSKSPTDGLMPAYGNNPSCFRQLEKQGRRQHDISLWKKAFTSSFVYFLQ